MAMVREFRSVFPNCTNPTFIHGLQFLRIARHRRVRQWRCAGLRPRVSSSTRIPYQALDCSPPSREARRQPRRISTTTAFLAGQHRRDDGKSHIRSGERLSGQLPIWRIVVLVERKRICLHDLPARFRERVGLRDGTVLRQWCGALLLGRARWAAESTIRRLGTVMHMFGTIQST